MTGYGTVARAFHWLIALMIVVMIPVGWTMTDEELGRPLQDRLFMLHKGLGSVILVLIVLRFAWRQAVPPPPLPEAVPAIQRTASAWVHRALYLAVFVMAASGYARVRLGGFPIELLDYFGIPSFLPENEAYAEIAKGIHAATIWAVLALVLVHVSAAAYHGIVRRDGVFSRMWPPYAPRRSGGQLGSQR